MEGLTEKVGLPNSKATSEYFLNGHTVVMLLGKSECVGLPEKGTEVERKAFESTVTANTEVFCKQTE